MQEITFTSEITVEEVQHCGSDEMIAHAARVSTKGMRADSPTQGSIAGLIGYLMKNRHGSPFEHGSLTVRVHAPIKVFREWHRHRIGWAYNEESGRYKTLDPVFYVPPFERPLIRPDGFKSASPDFTLPTVEQHERFVALKRAAYTHAYRAYEAALDMGVDRGEARDVLGVGIYSSCYCTANPRSLMHFLELRTQREWAKRPSKPLYEIAVAAEKLEKIFAYRWPITYNAWIQAGRMAP